MIPNIQLYQVWCTYNISMLFVYSIINNQRNIYLTFQFRCGLYHFYYHIIRIMIGIFCIQIKRGSHKIIFTSKLKVMKSYQNNYDVHECKNDKKYLLKCIKICYPNTK